MTFAPQSASWRTAVGPDLTRHRSRTVKRVRASEALGDDISIGSKHELGTVTRYSFASARSACPRAANWKVVPRALVAPRARRCALQCCAYFHQRHTQRIERQSH